VLKRLKGLDILCKANIICDNTDTVSLDNGLFRSIPTIELLTSRLNKTALQEGHKLGFELEKIILNEESLGPETVRYLLVERDADGLSEILEGVMDGLEDFDVEKPNVNFFAFYHPEVSIQARDGEEARFMPRGRGFTRGPNGIVEFNIALPPEDLVTHIARELTFFALSERAFSRPSLKVVNDYHRSLFERTGNKGFARTVNALEKRLSKFENLFEELSVRLEEGGSEFLGRLETLVRRVESVPKHLIGD
jgi:hypothetical protein